MKWDTVILKKTEELGRFLLGKSESLDFTDPVPKILRSDSLEMRKKILNLTQKQAQNLGISRGTIYYLSRQAKKDRSFKIYKKVESKLR